MESKLQNGNSFTTFELRKESRTMNFILADFNKHQTLLPFTYTRPACEIRCGILTLREKWEKQLGTTVSFQTEDYLQTKYLQLNIGNEDKNEKSTIVIIDDFYFFTK